MNAAVRERLFGFDHAFDHVVVRGVTVGIVILLVAVPLLFAALRKSCRITPVLDRELKRRYYSWLVLVPLLLGPILLGAAWTILGVCVLSLFCFREYSRATGLFRERAICLVVFLGILTITFAVFDHWYGFFVAITPLTVGLIAAVAIFADRPAGYIQRVGLGALGFLLFGTALGHLGYIANDTHYRPLMILILLAVEMNDVFAFAVGKVFGRRPLAPNTSPKKTIEGSLGALSLTTLLVVGVGMLIYPRDYRLANGVSDAKAVYFFALFGAIIGVVGQLGDLMLSSVKRDLGIKDFGALIPGHGGLLDRFDSLILVAPAAFHYIHYVAGVGLTEPTQILNWGMVMEPWKLRPANDLGLSPVERMRSPRREGGLVSAALGYVWGIAVRSYLKVWHRLTIHGAENVAKEAPFLLVANHSSHLDALVLAAAVPHWLRSRIFPLAAGDVFFESPWSSVAAAGVLNALPVWRKGSVGRTFQWLRERLVSEPCGFILFPEGTRSRDGRMGAFKAGVGLLVAGTEVPVIPCFLTGCFEALPPGCKLPRRKRICLHVGEAIHFGEVGNDKAGWLAVAHALENAVRGLQPKFAE